MVWFWKRGRPTLLGVAALGWLGYKALQQWQQEDLRGQTVVITGGSRGLGLALAREFARSGCRLVLCARDAEELAQARADLQRRGAEVYVMPCDVTDQQQAQQLITQATAHFGQVDILVNNAGTIQVGPMQAAGVEDFETALNVMFWGMLYSTLAVLPQMRERQQGRIVNITSIGGLVSVPHLLPYSCAKFAAVGLSEGLRAELRHAGICVTTIVPGLMRTGSHLRAGFQGQARREFAWFALGATLPGLSIPAQRAARQIVRATRRGEAERILTLPAKVLGRFHGLFPGTTTNVLSLVHRLLPAASGQHNTRGIGMDMEQHMHSPLFNFFTRLGRTAASRFHQYTSASLQPYAPASQAQQHRGESHGTPESPAS